MWHDVVDLREFYGTARGRLARRLISRCLRQIWPELKGQRVAGVGYAPPYLLSFREEAERVIAIMPMGQGVARWPEGGANLACLAEELSMPLPDRSIDRLVLVHCLEGTSEPRALMRECWRVLADGGRLLVVVANRSGFWARAEHSPFAQGRPYSMSQISKLLRDGLFAPVQASTALFIPPMWWRMFGAWASDFDQLGARWFPTLAGVIAVEAEKQIYAVPFDGVPARVAVNRASARTPLARREG